MIRFIACLAALALLTNGCSVSRTIAVGEDPQAECIGDASSAIGKDVALYRLNEMTLRGRLLGIEDCTVTLLTGESDTLRVEMKPGDDLLVHNDRIDPPGTIILTAAIVGPFVLFLLIGYAIGSADWD